MDESLDDLTFPIASRENPINKVKIIEELLIVAEFSLIISASLHLSYDI